jgi:hypothetical protein
METRNCRTLGLHSKHCSFPLATRGRSLHIGLVATRVPNLIRYAISSSCNSRKAQVTMPQRDLGTGTTQDQNPARISQTHSSPTDLTECGQRPESGSLVTRKDLPTPLYVLPQNALERTVRCEGPMATRMHYRQERDFACVCFIRSSNRA